MIRNLLILVGMNIIWSGSSVAVKLGLEDMPALTLVFWRMGVSVLLLIGVILYKKVSFHLHFRDVIRIISLGVVIAASHMLWVSGLNYTGAANASLLYAFEPIWSIVMATIFLREKFHSQMAIGLVLALLGLVILSDISISKIDSLFKPSIAFGNLLVVLGLFCESLFSIIAKPLSDRCSPLIIIAGALIVTQFILSICILVNGQFILPTSSKDITIILYLAIPCTTIGYVIWVASMKHLPVNVMLYTIFIQPVFGPLIAAIALNEIISGKIFGGGIFILSGTLIAIVSYVFSNRTSVKTISPSILVTEVE